MTQTNTPILYGVPFSQPVRAVMWLMLYKKTAFKMVLINPGSKGDNGSRHPSFLAKNPAGTIPTLEEPANGFTLGEAHAIMCYLCNKHSWTDLYPAEPQARAKVDWYLNFHHRNVREASVGLVAPKIRKDLDIPESFQTAARNTLTSALRGIESGWLANNDYLIGNSLSIADFAAYVEIGQLQPQFTNVYDFGELPRVQAWLKRMQQVDKHDEIHSVLSTLGDISVEAPSMDKIKAANKNGLVTLKQCLAEINQTL